MQLNLSTDIALRTLIYLGRKGGSATISEISESFGISRTHLMKVAMTLVAEKLLLSERGRNGGIRLARDASDIRIGDVVMLMENNLALLFCMKGEAMDDNCALLPDCQLRGIFFSAQESFFATLNESTLADLLSNNLK